VDEAAVAKSLSINMLCAESEDKSLEVATENGLSTNKSKKMDPVFWTAMCEDCNFDISTQCRLNMHLKYHFGALLASQGENLKVIKLLRARCASLLPLNPKRITQPSTTNYSQKNHSQYNVVSLSEK
jgi:hypothetical protein